MSIFTKKKEKRASTAWLTTSESFDSICSSGYTSLDKNPEVLTACRKIADMISTMTIYLMANTEKGDLRIVNELSKKVDIYPNAYMTRKTFMDFIVMNLLLHGKGNSVVVPQTKDGYLENLIPVPASNVSFFQENNGYFLQINGKRYEPENVLHFVLNPDKNFPWKGAGLTVTLKDVADSLKQASTTAKAFMSSKWKPSLVVKVDALTDEFSSPAGRRKLLDSYVNNEAGEPWIIPAEQFSVEQIRPLSLGDLAISDMVTLDKKTVASIIGVPPFVLGVGDYKAEEWNAFINNTVRPIAKEIEQELTRKLLVSPKMYWKFNMASLYSYDLKNISDVYSSLFVRGIVTGNEVREKIGMAPLDGLDDLVILENYIPIDKVGEQKKLVQEGTNGTN